ncbi:MAG: tyrosine--tRNA ligase [bacterium]|nr:tyrosine--tRNA ligase [bacterium]
MPVSTDEKKIDELLSRSIAQILPTKDELKKALMSGKQLRFYIGTDATGPQLHLGHSTNYLLLEKFRQLGHEIIILFGDFTALIGDPTDKEAARKQQTPEEVENHIRDWKSQVSKIVDFDNAENPAKILKNSEWLSKLNFADVLNIASNFTVQQMLERDMFEKRIEAGKLVYLHEFLYPLMQGYDSVAMDVDVEVGGTDQTFNMLVGRTLQKRIHTKEKFVISTTLLENPATGKKLMSKSEGDYIALNDSPSDMYGKTMALSDVVLRQMFVDTTLLPISEIDSILQLHPKEAKMRLARELVGIYHTKEAAQKAEKNFVSTFSEGGVPSDIQEAVVQKGALLHEALEKLGESKSELRRLAEAGAIGEVLPAGRQVVVFKDINTPVERNLTLRIGKHRFLKITIV